MAGTGPPPKAANQRQRRNATYATTRLPAEGRKGRAPTWPLIPDVVMTTRRNLAEAKVSTLELKLEEAEFDQKPTSRIDAQLDRAREKLAILDAQLAAQRDLEARLWRDLWKLPQAVAWERLGWFREVAIYVRHHVLGELGELDQAKEARQWSDRLGLTSLAMLRLRWEVVTDETAARREQKTVRSAPRQPEDPYAALRAV